MCDFWARIKISKKTVEELVEGLIELIALQSGYDSEGIEGVFDEYWSLIGVRNRKRLCREEPCLCEKMLIVERRAASRIKSAEH